MLDKKLFIELQKYVDNHLLSMPVLEECKSICYSFRSTCEEIQSIELEDFVKNKKMPSFSQMLLGYIDKKRVADSDIYKKAGIDRRHFSKIRSRSDYHPGKNTVIALALALELNKKETDKLLSAAGYSLSDSDIFDLVIQFCLEHQIYDIFDVNQALDYFSLKPLIGEL